MSDEDRYYAMQDDSAIENHPAFDRGYQAGLCDGHTEESDRIREELLAWTERNRYILFSHGAEGFWLSIEEFRAALDRIIPESKGKKE